VTGEIARIAAAAAAVIAVGTWIFVSSCRMEGPTSSADPCHGAVIDSIALACEPMRNLR
jgi:hypothetical protein